MRLIGPAGLTFAVFICAALVLAPMSASAGAGRGTDAGPIQIQQDPDRQSGFGQDNRPPGMDHGNVTGFGNLTPQGRSDQDPGNRTALNYTPLYGHHGGNMTALNMTKINLTDIPPPE